MRLILTLFTLLCLTLPTQAKTPFNLFANSAALPSSCPYGTALPDGCLNAPATSTFTYQDTNGITDTQFNTTTVALVGPPPYTPFPYTRPASLNFNVAGWDYPVGIKTYPNNCVYSPTVPSPPTTYRCTVNNLKDPTYAANMTGDPGIASHCVYNTASRHEWQCTSVGAFALTVDGWDFSGVWINLKNWTDQASSPLVFKNNAFIYTAGADVYWASGVQVGIGGGGTVTFEYNYIDTWVQQWMSDATGTRVTTANSVIGFPSAGTTATNTDCGAATSYCVQYNAFLRAPIRISAVTAGSSCTVSATPCSGQTWQYNAIPNGSGAPWAKMTGWMDDGSASTPTSNPGLCWSVASTVYGNTVPNDASSQLWSVDLSNAFALVYPATSCNSHVATSYLVTTNDIAHWPSYATNATITAYLANGVHPDPQFYAVGSGITGGPIYFGPLVFQYNMYANQPTTFGGTGLVTWMTSNAAVMPSALVDDGTGTNTAGNIFTARSITGGSSPLLIVPGMYLGAFCDNNNTSASCIPGTSTYILAGTQIHAQLTGSGQVPTSAIYSPTGTLTLTFSSPYAGFSSPTVGTLVPTTGFTGTGSVASMNGAYKLSSSSGGGDTIVLSVPASLTLTIDPGSGVIGTGGIGTYSLYLNGSPATSQLIRYGPGGGIENNVAETKGIDINHNVMIGQVSEILSGGTPGYPNGAGIIFGGGHPIYQDSLNVSNNFMNPIGSQVCIAPSYLNNPSPYTIAGNVNFTDLTDPYVNQDASVRATAPGPSCTHSTFNP